MVLRHLNLHRSMDMMSKLDGFVREAVGHKYAISIAKILKR